MSARAHHVSFRDFSGGFSRRSKPAATAKAVGASGPSALAAWFRRAYETLTTPPETTEIGRAFAYSFASRPVPPYAGRGR